jgi:transposase
LWQNIDHTYGLFSDQKHLARNIQVTFGHSKKHRKDLKQFLWSMSVSSDHAFPLLSGIILN